MQDRDEYQMHNTHTRTAYRQHYEAANAPTRPRVPTWVKVLVIVACIGLAGGLAGCGGSESDSGELRPAVFEPKRASGG